MAQHKSSRRRVFISALKHKNAANSLLDVIEGLTSTISEAAAKVAADSNGAWDQDYITTLGIEATDFDAKTIGQHKASLRKILIDKLCHKYLGNEMSDVLEEAEVSLNAVLAKMDAGAGTLDPVDANWDALKVDVSDVDAYRGYEEGQMRTSFKKVLISALSHTRFGRETADEIKAIQEGINSLIEDIKAKN